ncbi:hypothetical protein PR202_gb24045 [Eleusine coracana subsp. coracana]|uniref:Polyamine transporter PUT1 n=1 Tax=Eleusine coracana subsp. coracana TaxID=191504 RepID=A0AAV5FJV7_ELECO|nr:hypothetical protein QOZ80_5BG0443720 [Eleusine coracana subsp. coracana]GJN35291.1 hypothetical protein PR202_gb24045 [Eleusine coracana subsp. coracana]
MLSDRIHAVPAQTWPGILVMPCRAIEPKSRHGMAQNFLVASGTLDNALYPVLFLDYLRAPFPPPLRSLAVLGLTAALTYLNHRGLHLVGLSALALTAFSLSPFVALTALAIPKIRPSRWLAVDVKSIDLRGFFNSMFWNLNYWDKASTLAGEVEDPRRTFPRAVFAAVGLVVGAYLVPLLAGTGALPAETASEWTDGFFSEVGNRIGGPWLRVWVQAAAALSNMGLFEAEMSSDSFQLLGMAEMGMIPAIFARRSRHGTPTFSILCSATGVVILSFMSFQEIIEFLNFLYGLGMLAVFAAFVKLRAKDPDLPRPYRIPLGTAGAAAMCVPPVVLIVAVMCLASAKTVAVSAAVVVAGVALYVGVEHAKRRGWVEFLAPVPKTDGSSSSHGSSDVSADDVEDVRAGLLSGEPEEDDVGKVK